MELATKSDISDLEETIRRTTRLMTSRLAILMIAVVPILAAILKG